MADFVKIQLIQGAAEDGTGGTVIDSPSAKMPDGHLALILGSFEAVKGVERTLQDGTTERMTKARNYTFRLREYTSEVVKAAAVKKAKADAEAAASAGADAAVGAVEVVE